MNKIQQIYNQLYKSFGKQNWWPVTSKNPRFEIIIGAILTQNTSWKNVEKAILNLRKNNLIDIDKINKINKKRLASLIRSAGYYNQKAERLKIIADFLSRYEKTSFFKSPRKLGENKNPTREQLLEVKGIGPETADSILLYAYNKPYFVIDAYTKRIMKKLGYKQKTYEELQNLFAKNLPKNHKLFNEYHALLVELGKNHCRKKPECENCPVNDVCKKTKL